MIGPCLSRWLKAWGSKGLSIKGFKQPARLSKIWVFPLQAEKPDAIKQQGATHMTSLGEPTILVIFGGMGDLTWRKLAPALYNLHIDQALPEQFAVIGVDIKSASQKDFCKRLR